MATVSDYKGNEYYLSKGTNHVEVVYDFAVDGGATGALDLIKFKEAVVIEQFYVKVNTACTSGGSATVIVGTVGGDTDALLDATDGAVANLTLGAALEGDLATSVAHKVAADGVIAMTIGTAALTAGKITFVFKVAQF